MAKRKSTAEELLDLISDLCFHLPVWAILLIPIVCGGGSYLAIDYLIQNKLQMMFPGEIGGTITVSVSLLVFALTAVAALKGFLGRKQRKALLAQTQSLDALRALSWQEFELLIAEVYRTEGFKVTELGGNGPDGGIDLTATASNGDHYLIQCKHFKTSKVGVKIVREMLGVLAKEGAHQAVVIATGAYTQDAIQFAEGQPGQKRGQTQIIKILFHLTLHSRKKESCHSYFIFILPPFFYPGFTIFPDALTQNTLNTN
jgi:restriction system protein